LVYDLFTNYIEAANELGKDEEFRKKVESMRSRLLGPQIGKWGQLQEWAEDRDGPNDKHRHLSHLIAVHPGRQISPVTTPKLAEAARVSMNGRGDGGTGWSKAWKISIWARLHDGNCAYKLLQEQLHGNFYGNLLSFDPPFQIDGNFGYAAGVCEMLLQSHMQESGVRGQESGEESNRSSVISDQLGATGTPRSAFRVPHLAHLLPALPDAWATGSVKGLKARGGFVVDMAWKDGKLTEAKIKSLNGRPLTVKYGDQLRELKTTAGKTYTFDGALK